MEGLVLVALGRAILSVAPVSRQAHVDLGSVKEVAKRFASKKEI